MKEKQRKERKKDRQREKRREVECGYFETYSCYRRQPQAQVH